jgi:hypothetical protein
MQVQENHTCTLNTFVHNEEKGSATKCFMSYYNRSLNRTEKTNADTTYRNKCISMATSLHRTRDALSAIERVRGNYCKRRPETLAKATNNFADP